MSNIILTKNFLDYRYDLRKILGRYIISRIGIYSLKADFCEVGNYLNKEEAEKFIKNIKS